MTANWIVAFTVIAFAAAAAAAAEGLNVWIAPDTCKVNPRSGNVLEEHTFHEDPSIPPPGYLRRRMGKLKGLPYYVKDSYAGATTGKLRTASPVWDAARKTVTLRAARNEFAAFQVVVENTGDAPLKGVTVGRPALRASRIAGAMASFSSTRRPWQPNPSATWSSRVGPSVL